MGFGFHQDVNMIRDKAIATGGGVYVERVGIESGGDTGVIGIGHQSPFGVGGVGSFNHFKERELLRFAIDNPRGIEDFMSAVFRDWRTWCSVSVGLCPDLYNLPAVVDLSSL